MKVTEDHDVFFPLHFCAAGSAVAQKETGRLAPEVRGMIQKKYALPRRGSAFLIGMLAAVDDLLQNWPEIKLSRRTALVVSSMFGPQDMIYGFQDELMDFPEDQVMAGRFAQSVHNAPAGGLAIALGLTGPSYSITGIDNLFPESIRLAYSLLRNGSCDSVLLISGEDKSSVSDALKTYKKQIPDERYCAFIITISDHRVPMHTQTYPSDPVGLLQQIQSEKENIICPKI